MSIAFVDIESTGTDPSRHHLWEIAVILRTEAGDAEYCWQIRPDLTTADPMALRISRYFERCDLNDRPAGAAITMAHPDLAVGEYRDADEVADRLAVILNNVVLAAANVAFDAAFLDRFLRANGQAPAWDYHLLEVESYAAGAIGAEPPWKLDKLATALGIPLPTDRHSALADARLARDVFDAARGRV